MEEKKEDFRIICGTYEKLIYGINAFWGKVNNTDDDVEMKDAEDVTEPLDPKEIAKQKKIDETSLGLASNNKALRLDPIFIYPSHISYIKCIGIGGHHMASGGTDEVIKLYDLKKRKEVGTLLHHSGTITCLTFFQKTHMISSGEDGEICLWRTKDWEKLTSFKGHKSGVTSVAIHPSGKLALSISTDKTLRCWNLVEGKAAYTLKLYRKDALKIFWNKAGTLYGILFDREVIVYDAANPNQCHTFTHKGRINDFRFVAYEGQDYLVTGSEDKKIRLYDLATTQKCLAQWDNGSESRIKCIDVMEHDSVHLLCTCSSDGIINVWDLNAVFDLIEMEQEEADGEEKEGSAIMKDLEEVEPISRYKTGCRITCVSFAPPLHDKEEGEEEAEKEDDKATQDVEKEEEEEEESEDEEKEKVKPTKKVNPQNKNNNKSHPKGKPSNNNNKRKRKSPEGGKNKRAK